MFGTSKQLEKLRAIKFKTDKQGFIEQSQIDERSAITAKMLSIIECSFGKIKRDEVNSKL